MKILHAHIILLFQIAGLTNVSYSSNSIPADNPYIQYYGRWDFSSPSAPTHSWPGVYIYAVFEGTSVGISTNDNFCYYNVFVDDTVISVFHGTKSGVASYTLASALPDGHHTILLTLRNETNWTKFSFNGFILDNGKNLLPPPERPVKKIEFIGDSYTCASGNEWNESGAPSNVDLYTNMYEGFPSVAARHYNAQYMVSGHGGYGLVLDYLGNYSGNIPSIFDRTLVYTSLPKWDFSKWTPNLVVICLGLNDYNGWGGYSGPVSQENANLYRQKYHDFISTIMDVYPYAKILTVAPNDLAWLEQQISQVVSEENATGHTNVFYTYFPYYTGHYVNNGHPDVAAHHEIASRLIAAIDTIDAWTPFTETVRPKFLSLPDTPLVATSVSFVLTVKTDKYATARYSTQDKSFNQMENVFTTTGTRIHSVVLSCEQNKQYMYYVRAMDVYGNETDSSAVINFTVDTTKVLLTWRSLGYDLSQWKHGMAPLGNDSTGLYNTQIDSTKTAYYRHSLTFQNVSSIHDLRVYIRGHDGVVAYLNGREIGRINIDPSVDVTFNTYAIKPLTYATSIVMSTTNGLNYLQNGENVFSFEVHSRSTPKPDVLFDAQVFDANNTTYYDLGSDWHYYDKGHTPANQLVDKPIVGVLARNGISLPERTYLYANYPNPFNPSTNIFFDLNERSHVQLKVFNVLGQLVETLEDRELSPGNYRYTFDGREHASGIYIYQLITGTFVDVKRMVLIK